MLSPHTQYYGGNKPVGITLKALQNHAHNLQLQEMLQNQHY